MAARFVYPIEKLRTTFENQIIGWSSQDCLNFFCCRRGSTSSGTSKHYWGVTFERFPRACENSIGGVIAVPVVTCVANLPIPARMPDLPILVTVNVSVVWDAILHIVDLTIIMAARFVYPIEKLRTTFENQIIGWSSQDCLNFFHSILQLQLSETQFIKLVSNVTCPRLSILVHSEWHFVNTFC